MITYAYSGRDHSGQAISGEVRAQTREMAVSQLIRQGVTPVKVNEKKRLRGESGETQEQLPFGKV